MKEQFRKEREQERKNNRNILIFFAVFTFFVCVIQHFNL